MSRFYLSDAQWAAIQPHLPPDQGRKPRVDDRRVISGVIHVLQSGWRCISRQGNAPISKAPSHWPDHCRPYTVQYLLADKACDANHFRGVRPAQDAV